MEACRHYELELSAGAVVGHASSEASSGSYPEACGWFWFMNRNRAKCWYSAHVRRKVERSGMEDHEALVIIVKIPFPTSCGSIDLTACTVHNTLPKAVIAEGEYERCQQ